MKKNKKQNKIVRSKAFKLGLSIFAGVAAIGATCGIAIGLCSTATTKYVDLNPYSESNIKTDYSSAARAQTVWLADNNEPATATSIMTNIDNPDYLGTDNFNNRFNYAEVVGNGPDTSIMDKSFQQSAYYAQTYWIHKDDSQLKGGTNWNWENPIFDYDKFPLDSLVMTNNTTTPVAGQFASAAQKPSGLSNSDFVNTYKSAYKAGKKVLLFPGFQHIGPTSNLKVSDPTVYDNMGFILVDTESIDLHIASLQFRAEQSSFLAAIATCQYLQENWEDVYSKVNNGQLALGAFGGQIIPPVIAYLGGLELGVWFYNTYILPHTDYYKNADEHEKDKRTVKFINLGKKESFFSGTFVIGDAKLLAQELLAKGACAIMAAAGPQTGDVVSEIVAQKSPCRVIGVDSAMENGDWGQYISASSLLPDNTKVVLCSAEKNIGQIASQVLDNVWKGRRVVYPDFSDGGKYKVLPDGKTISDIKTLAGGGDLGEASEKGAIGTVGYTTVGNMYNKGINLSDGGKDYLVTALKYISTYGQITSYTDAVMQIVSTELPEVTIDGVTIKNKTALDLIDENHYFLY